MYHLLWLLKKTMSKQKVTDKECMEAIEYLFVEGFVDEMTSDKKYYTTILLKKVADVLNLNLIWEK